MAKNTCDPAIFLLQQQSTLRQSEVESQPPPKKFQNLQNRPGDNPPAGLVAPHLVQLVDLSLLAALLQEEDHPRCALDPEVSPITGAALFLHWTDMELILEMYLQGPCVRGIPLPPAVWWL